VCECVSVCVITEYVLTGVVMATVHAAAPMAANSGCLYVTVAFVRGV